MLNSKHNFQVQKCKHSRCKTCPILISLKKEIHLKGKTICFNQNMNCRSKNVVYVLICRSCDKIYVGETSQSLHMRMNLHRQHINHEKYSIQKVLKHLKDCGQEYSVIPIFKSTSTSSYVLVKIEKYSIAATVSQ